jgi:hypothetical protein
LVHWTVGRITGALVPLLAAGVAMAWCDTAELSLSTMAEERLP